MGRGCGGVGMDLFYIYCGQKVCDQWHTCLNYKLNQHHHVETQACGNFEQRVKGQEFYAYTSRHQDAGTSQAPWFCVKIYSKDGDDLMAYEK